MSWKACSLFTKLTELELYMTTNNVVVALIQETWLSPSIDITLTNYNIVRKDRNTGRPGGGVAILIHKNLSHHPLQLFPTNNL